MIYEDWAGLHIGDVRTGAVGEAGFMLEAHLWGGVLRWGLSDQSVPLKRLSLVHEAGQNKWSTVRFLMLHRGSFHSKERFIICVYILSFTIPISSRSLVSNDALRVRERMGGTIPIAPFQTAILQTARVQ